MKPKNPGEVFAMIVFLTLTICIVALSFAVTYRLFTWIIG